MPNTGMLEAILKELNCNPENVLLDNQPKQRHHGAVCPDLVTLTRQTTIPHGRHGNRLPRIHMQEIQPYTQEGHFTPMNNWFWDVAIKRLSANGWKLFCFLYRQTHGWQRTEIVLSQRQLSQGTNIRDNRTVARAINEIKQEGLIVVIERVGKSEIYRLNHELKVASPQKMRGGEGTPPTKNEGTPPTKNEGTPPTKNEGTYKRNGKKGSKTDPDGSAAAELNEKILEITKALELVSQDMPRPIQKPEYFAKKLFQTGMTAEAILNGWQACQNNGDKPAGAFMYFLKSGHLPITTKASESNNPPPPSSAAPPAPQNDMTFEEMRAERDKRRKRK